MLDWKGRKGLFALRTIEKKNLIKKRDGIHGRSPLKGIISEHSEQALMVINISFQTTALKWILSLDKKSTTAWRRKNALRAQ